jgi:HPt (histidine-containing phosphotransfer) domain-containing protein
LEGLLRDSKEIDLPDLMNDLSAGVAAGNSDSVRRTAHAIKGVVGVFQAATALGAAKRLEDSARAKETEKFAVQQAELVHAVFDLLTSLERFLAGPASQAA